MARARPPTIRRCTSRTRMRTPTRPGPARSAHRGRVGTGGPGRVRRGDLRVGRRRGGARTAPRELLARALPLAARRRVRLGRRGGLVSGERLWAPRHGRNVWEWTADWWSPHHPETPDEECCVPSTPRTTRAEDSYDPAQPQFRIPRRTIKGGSYLCADSYCQRYRPAARRPQMVDTGMSHIGFRSIRRTVSAA